MKPIILTVHPNKEGKITINIDELEDMLDKAYEAGKEDGQKYYYYYPTSPYIPTLYPYYDYTKITPVWITCDSTTTGSIGSAETTYTAWDTK